METEITLSRIDLDDGIASATFEVESEAAQDFEITVHYRVDSTSRDLVTPAYETLHAVSHRLGLALESWAPRAAAD